mmetsp:Transcript_25351/g.53564  ORF Transcript_25351/g.53564 Transcript_25351/m.53564 type:complete len:137 (+) Transcript_25351:234-644(+)
MCTYVYLCSIAYVMEMLLGVGWHVWWYPDFCGLLVSRLVALSRVTKNEGVFHPCDVIFVFYDVGEDFFDGWREIGKQFVVNDGIFALLPKIGVVDCDTAQEHDASCDELRFTSDSDSDYTKIVGSCFISPQKIWLF